MYCRAGGEDKKFRPGEIKSEVTIPHPSCTTYRDPSGNHCIVWREGQVQLDAIKMVTVEGMKPFDWMIGPRKVM